MEIMQVCNIVFSNLLPGSPLTEDISCVLTEMLKKRGFVILIDNDHLGPCIRVYKEIRNEKEKELEKKSS